MYNVLSKQMLSCNFQLTLEGIWVHSVCLDIEGVVGSKWCQKGICQNLKSAKVLAGQVFIFSCRMYA